MTTRRPTPAAPPCSAFRRHLKRVGLKYTTERADLLDAVVAFDGLFDADELAKALARRPTPVSKATIYRTLKLLVEAGILAERPDARHSVRYEVVHGRPPVNVEVRRPDGSRVTLHDDRVARIAVDLARAAGISPDRHVLIIEPSDR
jgi:Fe2+ or Zn2+ uptake regulation protein